MSNHLFSTTTTNNHSSYKYYSIRGREDFFDDEGLPRINSEENEFLAAKSVQNKKPKHFNSTANHYRFYIKIFPNGKVYNPIDYFKIKDKDPDRLVNSICKDGWAFKEVNKATFDKYIQFLNTLNLAWLKEVERDISI